MKLLLSQIALTSLISPLFLSTGLALDPSLFIADGLVEDIRLEERASADGSTASYWVITTHTTPQEHEIGPFSPTHVSDGADKGGIWLESGQVYDVDGAFIEGLPIFYNDANWNLVRDDGSIQVTETIEAFEAAARPNVDPLYQNHAVEGKAEWVADLKTTFVIPANPVMNATTTRLSRGSLGVALNGVGYDPPAPVAAILGAYTIAPFDDSGGHINPAAGYHYHAATGKTKEVAQGDGHAPLIGYALDGFPIFAHLDEAGNAATDLDAAGGHEDSERGYHYHAGAPGSNQIIQAYRGTPGSVSVESDPTAVSSASDSAQALEDYVTVRANALDFEVVETNLKSDNGWVSVSGKKAGNDEIATFYIYVEFYPFYYHLADFEDEDSSNRDGWDYALTKEDDSYFFTFADPSGFWTWTDGEAVVAFQ